MTQSRQLAAIMFTDIVGYTKLMGEDEQAALELLKKNRSVQRPIIEKYNGRWLKEIGDGVLASFSTVTDAVYCAGSIQKSCDSDPDLKLRIGIHLGEVVFDEGDVFGDGVNIASRLEPLAPPGGIIISGSVYKNVVNKTGIVSTLVGEKELKGVKESVKVYQVKILDPIPFSAGNNATNSSKQKSTRYLTVISIIAVGIILFLSYILSIQSKQITSSSIGITRYQLGLSESEAMIPSWGVSLAVSPDGDQIVYVGPSPSNEGQRLWLKNRVQLKGIPLLETNGALQPFFSPDGRSIGFFTSKFQLKVMSLSDRTPIVLVDKGVDHSGGAWGQDDRIYYGSSAGVMSIKATGGDNPQKVTTPDPLRPEILGHAWPEVLPNGKGMLYKINRNHIPNDIAILNFDTGESQILVQANLGRYASTGHLLYIKEDGAVMAAPFDQQLLKITGPAVLLTERTPRGITPDFAVSFSGRLVYATYPERTLEVVRVERDGIWSPIDPENPLRGIRYVALSPDGNSLAVTTYLRPPADDGNIWIKKLPTGAFARLTFEGNVNIRPAWTPDGRSVTFISNRGGSRDVWTKRADFIGDAEPLLQHAENIDEALISLNGKWIIFRKGMQNGVRDLFAIRLNMTNDTVPLVTSRFDEVAPALSPSGRYLAFVANRTNGIRNVYVRPFPEMNTEIQVSSNGGIEPVWARNGKELFFKNGQGDLVAISVDKEYPIQFGPEQVLFSALPYKRDNFHAAFDVTVDGKAFIMIRESNEGILKEEIIVVENWFEELRQRLDK